MAFFLKNMIYTAPVLYMHRVSHVQTIFFEIGSKTVFDTNKISPVFHPVEKAAGDMPGTVMNRLYEIFAVKIHHMTELMSHDAHLLIKSQVFKQQVRKCVNRPAADGDDVCSVGFAFKNTGKGWFGR